MFKKITLTPRRDLPVLKTPEARGPVRDPYAAHNPYAPPAKDPHPLQRTEGFELDLSTLPQAYQDTVAGSL